MQAPALADWIPLLQDGRACTQGLETLHQVKVLRLEHVKVTCLPPNLEELTLLNCRVVAPQPAHHLMLRRLAIVNCSNLVNT